MSGPGNQSVDNRREGGLRLDEKMQPLLETNACYRVAHTTPLVSIVTVVFNGKAHLERTIQSVLQQSYRPIEYVVIDGGSTDGTVDLLVQFNDRLDYWLSEPDGGISDAFNKGLQAATGKYIGLINADDWYSPDAIELAVNALESHHADVVHGQLQYWSSDKKMELVSGNHDLLDRDMTVNHPTLIARRTLYEEIGGFDLTIKYAMDYDWVRRAVAHGASFHYLPHVLANMSLGGISDVRWRRAIWEVAKIKTRHRPNSFRPWIQYAFQLTRGISRRVLEKLGLRVLVRIYHEKFSLVKKLSQ